jgi:signal peptidase I
MATALIWIAVVTMTATTTLGLLTRRLVLVTVNGVSMAPTYSPGDRLLVWRTQRPGRGRVVVIEPPPGPWSENSTDRWLIKRVDAIAGDPLPLPDARGEAAAATVPAGMLYLLGDNRARSMDSRQLGLFSTRQLLGTVCCRI